MAERDHTDTSIIGRDADAAGSQARGSHVDGADLAEQLNQTTTEDAGGNVSGTASVRTIASLGESASTTTP